MAKSPEERAARLTQRLDHMVPDPELTAAENQRATAELGALASKLNALLPDPSLSPFEKLERLSRVVDRRQPDLTQLQSAATKVEALTNRLNQLVPGDQSPDQKINSLVRKLDSMVPQDAKDNLVMHKLEMLGDPRGRVEPE